MPPNPEVPATSWTQPVSLAGRHVRLEPLAREHAAGLRVAAAEGELWQRWYTSVPPPDGVEAYIRAALVLTHEEGIPHLDKFAVSEDAQGEGLGRAAWQVMRDATPRLFWRARSENTVNDFYFDESDGCLKGPKWNVFWYGLETWDEIRFAVDHCRARPASLKD